MVYYRDVLMSLYPEQKTPSSPPKRVFFAAFIVIFFSALSASDSVGFVPCSLDGTCAVRTDSIALSSLPTLGEETTGNKQQATVLPVRIEVEATGIDLPVQNPGTRDVQALDDILRKGPARYVDSAKLGQNGNVLIFAHSSHLPIVHNQMFRAFNTVPQLKTGDSITLVGDDGKRYRYSVDDVAKANVESGASVDLSPTRGKKLTLVTCDTLTGTSARFILTATFVDAT